MTPFARIFAILFLIFALIWGVAYGFVYINPSIALSLTVPIMISGWGSTVFFILFVIMFILKR